MFKKLFSKLISRKFWGGLVLVNLLISGLQVPKVLAQNPVWNSFSGEQEFLKVGYQSADGKNIIDYADQVTAPVEAKAGDLIKARIYFHNGNPGTIATNAIAKLTGVSGESSKFTPSASLSADFTETVTDAAEINLPKSFKLEYVTGSTKKWTLSDPVNGPDKFDKIVSLSDGITTDNGVNFGDPKINGIEGCWEFRGFITLWLRLTEISPPAGSVTIKKTVVDKNDNPLTDPNDLKGFEFKIKGKGIDQTVVTDEKGEAKFANLPIGPYEVNETSRTGYEIISTMPVLVNISNANLNWELKIKNRKLEEPQPVKGSVKVVKILLDETGKEIAKPNDLYKNWQIVLKGVGFEKTALTDEKGEVSFLNLNLGPYEVDQAPKTDWLTQTSLPVLVNLSEQNPNFEVKITDKAKEQPVFGSVKIKKILLDENGREVTRPNEKLAGFEFKISGKDGFVKTVITANDGLVSFNNLAIGNYEISETARDGYRIKTSLPILVILSKVNPNQEVSVTNETIPAPPVKGQITVEKRLLDDKGTLIPTNDVRYKDWTIKLAGKNGFDQNLITDQGGRVTFANLDLGQYEVNQVSKADWLTRTKLPILVNLTQANPIQKVVIEDKLKEVVEPPVLGRIKTVVNLIDENDNPIAKPSDYHKDWEIILKGVGFEKRLKTDNQGVVDFTDLKLGTYELDQVLKNGWEELSLLPMIITLTKENNSYVVNITNGRIAEIPEPKGLVRIIKTLRDENGQPINPPSSQLIGFEFKLIDANGLTRTALTDSNGKVEFNDIPLGKYTLNETPRSGYQINTQMPIEFELTKDLSGVQIGVENRKLAAAVPDLQIKKYISGDNGATWFNKDKDGMVLAAKPGSQLLYKIVIWNTGNADAQNVKITDIMGNEQFYQSIESPNTIIDLVSAKDNKTEATGKVITYKAVLKNNFPEGLTILDNIAFVEGDQGKSSSARVEVFVMPIIPPSIIDRTIVTEVIREVNTGGAPAIFIEKTVRNLTRGDKDYSNQTNAGPGEEVEYKVYFRNNTAFEALDINLRDVLPSGVSLISGSARLNRGGTESALGDFVNGWINSLGNYKTNEEAFVTFKARLTDEVKDGSILVNTAYIAPRGFGISSDTALINVIAKTEVKPAAPVAGKELPKAGANALLLSVVSLVGSILGFAGTRLRDEKHFLKEMLLSYKMK